MGWHSHALHGAVARPRGRCPSRPGWNSVEEVRAAVPHHPGHAYEHCTHRRDRRAAPPCIPERACASPSPRGQEVFLLKPRQLRGQALPTQVTRSSRRVIVCSLRWPGVAAILILIALIAYCPLQIVVTDY